MAKNRTTASYVLGDKSTAGALRSPGWLAKWPLIGFFMFLGGGLIFGALAYNVTTNGPLLQWDQPITQNLHAQAAHAPTRTIENLEFGFFVGKELVQVIAAILVLYFLHKRFWREIMMVIIGFGGGGLIWYFLTNYFGRHRPAAQIGIIVTDPSFPSGHTITAVLCYGLLAYMLVPLMPSLFWKWFVVIMAVLIVVFVGYARLYLGGHYLTDLVAGYALGIAWAGLIYTLLEKYF
jgi:undecaprenyl-diphosphatase